MVLIHPLTPNTKLKCIPPGPGTFVFYLFGFGPLNFVLGVGGGTTTPPKKQIKFVAELTDLSDLPDRAYRLRPDVCLYRDCPDRCRHTPDRTVYTHRVQPHRPELLWQVCVDTQRNRPHSVHPQGSPPQARAALVGFCQNTPC